MGIHRATLSAHLSLNALAFLCRLFPCFLFGEGMYRGPSICPSLVPCYDFVWTSSWGFAFLDVWTGVCDWTVVIPSGDYFTRVSFVSSVLRISIDIPTTSSSRGQRDTIDLREGRGSEEGTYSQSKYEGVQRLDLGVDCKRIKYKGNENGV